MNIMLNENNQNYVMFFVTFSKNAVFFSTNEFKRRPKEPTTQRLTNGYKIIQTLKYQKIIESYFLSVNLKVSFTPTEVVLLLNEVDTFGELRL